MSSEIVCFFSQSQQLIYVVNASYKTIDEVTDNLGGEYQDLHFHFVLAFLNETVSIFRSSTLSCHMSFFFGVCDRFWLSAEFPYSTELQLRASETGPGLCRPAGTRYITSTLVHV